MSEESDDKVVSFPSDTPTQQLPLPHIPTPTFLQGVSLSVSQPAPPPPLDAAIATAAIEAHDKEAERSHVRRMRDKEHKREILIFLFCIFVLMVGACLYLATIDKTELAREILTHSVILVGGIGIGRATHKKTES